ncbi:transposase [Planctomycetales bacterium ZRK34]|nr:transposase [Planctomycetales bacterium ZRK34]
MAKLRQAEVELGKGLKVPEVCKQLYISEQTYYRWRTKYGGVDPVCGAWSRPSIMEAAKHAGSDQTPQTPAIARQK